MYSCLGMMQKIDIITKNTNTCTKCMKKCKKPGHCSTATLSQGQFYCYGSMIVPLVQISHRSGLNFVTKCCLRVLQKYNDNSENTKTCENA